MRCPDCNKFVPYDTDVDPEEETEPEVTDQNINATYRRVLNCGECGTELKEATIEIDGEISCSLPCKRDLRSIDQDPPEHDWEVEASSASGTERTEGKGRGLKTFYGVEVDVELKCTKCGTKHSQSFDNDEQASSFEELT